jgi:hypothetical protein
MCADRAGFITIDEACGGGQGAGGHILELLQRIDRYSDVSVILAIAKVLQCELSEVSVIERINIEGKCG